MKKLRLLLIGSFLLIITTAISFAQDHPEYIDLPADEYPAYVVPSSSGVSLVVSNDPSKMVEDIIGLVLFALILLHMIYILYVRTPRFKHIFSVDDFKQKRTASNRSQEMSQEEYNRCAELIGNIQDSWDDYEEDGLTLHAPNSMKQINVAVTAIKEMIEIAPTDETIIDEINGYTNVINYNEKRHFRGSKMLMVLASVFAIAPVFFDSWVQLFPLMSCVVLYYFACQKTLFVAERRNGKAGADSSFMWGIVNMAFSGNVYNVKWRDPDGNTGGGKDSTEWWLAFIFGMIMLVMFSMTISLWALIAYIRNYVIYK